MPNPVGSLTGPSPAPFPLKPSETETPASAGGFQQMLGSAIGSTAQMQNQAQATVQSSLAGGDVSMIQGMTEVRKADLALKLMLQIRNKLLEGFNEIKQMQF